MRIYILVLTAIFSSILLSAQNLKFLNNSIISIQKLKDLPEDPKGKLYVYSLPKTCLVLKFNISRKIYVSGPYAMYAGQLLGYKNSISANIIEWNIESVDLMPYLETDPDEYYGAIVGNYYKGDIFGKMQKENRIFFPTGSDIPVDIKWKTKEKTMFYEQNSPANLNNIGVIIRKDSLIKLSLYEKAKADASFIINLKERRKEMIMAEDDPLPPAKSMNIAIREMDKMIQEKEALFNGFITVEQYSFWIAISPGKNDNDKRIGIVNFDIENGISNYFNQAQSVYLTLEADKTLSEIYENSPAHFMKYKQAFYKVPEMTSVKIIHNGNILCEKRIPMYQFGTYMPFPL